MRRKNVRSTMSYGFHFDGVSHQNVVVREITPIDEFYVTHGVSSDDSRKCVGFTDPIRMLFNQQRLSKIGSSAVDAWLDSMFKVKHDPFKELRSKCSDADLKQIIKSRHIQQPCEIMAYVQECKNNMSEFNEALQAIIQLREEQSKITGKVEEPVNDEPK